VQKGEIREDFLQKGLKLAGVNAAEFFEKSGKLFRTG
jgi:hypothetical protein